VTAERETASRKTAVNPFRPGEKKTVRRGASCQCPWTAWGGGNRMLKGPWGKALTKRSRTQAGLRGGAGESQLLKRKNMKSSLRHSGRKLVSGRLLFMAPPKRGEGRRKRWRRGGVNSCPGGWVNLEALQHKAKKKSDLNQKHSENSQPGGN